MVYHNSSHSTESSTSNDVLIERRLKCPKYSFTSQARPTLFKIIFETDGKRGSTPTFYQAWAKQVNFDYLDIRKWCPSCLPDLTLLFVFMSLCHLHQKSCRNWSIHPHQAPSSWIIAKTEANQVKGCLASYKLQKEPPGQFAKGTDTCAADQTFGRIYKHSMKLDGNEWLTKVVYFLATAFWVAKGKTGCSYLSSYPHISMRNHIIHCFCHHHHDHHWQVIAGQGGVGPGGLHDFQRNSQIHGRPALQVILYTRHTI